MKSEPFLGLIFRSLPLTIQPLHLVLNCRAIDFIAGDTFRHFEYGSRHSIYSQTASEVGALPWVAV